MHEKIVALLVTAMLLTGCQASSEKADRNTTESSYEQYYRAIEDNTSFQNSSLYYTISGQMSTLPDGTHRYYVFLDDAQVAMYDVVMMAVENDTPYEETAVMMPSIGIFDQESYTLIPYQSYPEKGYVKGLVISGETEEDSVDLKILVEWRNASNDQVTREFLSYHLDENGFTSSGWKYAADEVTENEETEE